MVEESEEDTAPPFGGGTGARLRAAREARGLTLEQLAAETRIPRRHLQTIEAGEFAALPARTYAVGFSKTYARAVGLDEDEVTAGVRAELDALDAPPRHRPVGFEPGDPARIPSRRLVWIVGAGLLLLLAGSYAFMRTAFAPAAELPSLVEEREAGQAAAEQRAPETAVPAAPAVSGEVTFTAREQGIWVKFYDAAGRQLMQKQMDLGERYTVPADAQGPQVWTGRPDAFDITVGGRPVPRLSESERVMRDVPVTAEALLARAPPAATPSPPSPTT